MKVAVMKLSTSATNLDTGHRHLPVTWLSVGAVVRLSAALMLLAGVWLLVTWAVALP